MFHILGFIFFIVLIILLIGFFILWRIVNTFLGLGKRMTGGATQGQQRTTYQGGERTTGNSNKNQTTSSNVGDKKKLFSEDEGEYVEFEEIKD